MKSRLVADGGRRFENTPEFRERLVELRQTIHARYAERLAKTNFFQRSVLRLKMAADYRREKKHLSPSPQTLYSASR